MKADVVWPLRVIGDKELSEVKKVTDHEEC